MELEFHIVDTQTPTGTQSIDRAAQLLVRVVESAQPLAVGELADSTGLPKSTTSRLLAALERQGLLQRVDGRGRLRPGPVLLRFAQRDVPEANLVELSAPALRRLADESGETINLGVPTPVGVEHLAQRDSRHFVGATNWVGRRVPHDVSANGKVFLAFGAAPRILKQEEPYPCIRCGKPFGVRSTIERIPQHLQFAVVFFTLHSPDSRFYLVDRSSLLERARQAQVS